ncbi:Sds3-like protein [Cordyceps fumosorosea ARSEF 2679]|uniref:Sds3-like protein n=1 Tax=Cordyceps fumosorosea (strain ARSEF 2679) TaxID=1081104 RepID=A0A167ZIL4_CORFA|nr:Sds3-like protein [Cordyceps fumosorosea ARSEF 2679]OAA67561.1 Sds3-like protein [Cordyceps fumosorosea ARSEF 2679]
MAATATASTALAQSTADPDLEDSNVSSPLTEVDDKDDNDEEIDRMQIDADDGDNSSLSGDENPADDDRSDSASVLSDAGSDAHSEGNDTEAETERLYDTPRNQRQKDVVVDQYNHGQVFEHTPSKLRRTTKPEDKDETDDHENADHDSASGDAGSGASSADEADDTPTKPAHSSKTVHDKGTGPESQVRKRKRSPLADQSEIEQPQKRRSGSLSASLAEKPPLNLVEKATADAKSAVQSDADEENNRDTGTEGEAQERSSRSSRSSRKSTRNGRRSKDDPKDEEDDTGADAATETAGEDATDHHEDEAEPEVGEEDEADIAAKNQEEMERKRAAFKEWSHIETMFGIFRDRLYTEKLRRVEEEEQSLLADVPTHREYLNMKQCLDDRLNQRLQEVNTEFDLQLRANERAAVAQRAQIWSQFYQAVREKREQTLESLNKQWYDVQAARRNAHSLQDYGLLFPKDPTQRLRNAIAYNSEVSTLSGMAKYEGFPAGPDMKGASALELKSDFSAIERSRRGRQKPNNTFQQRDDYHSPNINHIGPAGEQFLKDTPWANPNHSAHKMARQGPTHEENRAVPQGPIFQNENPPPSLKSAALSARLSESPELSRSILKPPPHQMKRVASVPSANRTPKATAV